MANTQNQFLLVNGRVGWQAALLDKTVLACGGQSLQLQPRAGSVRPLADAAGSFGGFTHPAGLAVSAEGNVYILDRQACVVRQFDPCKQTFSTLACLGTEGARPRQLRDPHGIAISPGNDLYVADTGNLRVQVFSLKGLALRAVWEPLCIKGDSQTGFQVERAIPEFPASAGGSGCQPEPAFPPQTWEPWDVAVSRKGWVYVSDHANGLIHLFDPAGCWRKAFDGATASGGPFRKPTRIALDCEGNLYVVQEGRDSVIVLDPTGAALATITLPGQAPGHFRPIAVASDGQGNIYISESLTRCIYRYCRTADGAYAYTGNCGPLSNFGAVLAFDAHGNPLAASLQENQVLQLAALDAFETSGRYLSGPLDSRIYRCLWHRVVLRGSIEPGTRIRVDTLTSESPKSTEEVLNLPEERWATRQVAAQMANGRWDCLLDSPPGRYLWLRLTLEGDSSVTPRLVEIKLHYPRESSLQYLPAVYSQDPASQDFLGRFLSIFDTLRGGISNRVAHIARYFDPLATPAAGGPGKTDFLSWLASWLGLSLDRHWPLSKRRELLRQAYRLYRLRGTPAGLKLHIRLYTGAEPTVLEDFRLRRWTFLNHARLGSLTTLWGDAVVARLQLNQHSRIGTFELMDTGDPLHDPFDRYAHQFTVFVPQRRTPSEQETATLESIIEMAKPAHTQGKLVWVNPRLRVGIQAFVGIDTVVGRYPDQTREGQGKLGYDTVIGPAGGGERGPTMRVGCEARIGSSSLLD